MRRYCVLLFCCFSYCLSFGQKPVTLSTGGQTFQHVFDENILRTSAGCGVRAINRSIDGSCNNLLTNTTCTYGSTNIQLERLLPAGYTDGIGAIRSVPNARLISNEIHNQLQSIPSFSHSSMVFTWGQFLDHDISLTPEGSESSPIPLPTNEPLFQVPIEFHRSMTAPNSGVTFSREQLNIITAWIDASQIYGSDQPRADWLRTFQDGKLKTSQGNFLPYNTNNGEQSGSIDQNAPSMAGDRDKTVKMMVAGDVRANEQPGLLSLHTVFVREHNRIADQLLGSGLTDEEIYQYARKRVGALMQSITYNEFLPQLNLYLPRYLGYNEAINPNILQIFSSAAYRIGHTMVTSNLNIEDPQNGTSVVSLQNAFFNPSLVVTHDVGPILNGLANHAQQMMDEQIVTELRNFLFPVPGSPVMFGLDLAALNIQRGRDHGLPDYKSVRNFLIGDDFDGWEDINHDQTIQDALQIVYQNIDEVDLWTGLVCEGGSCCSELGKLEKEILRRQFQSLRDGDFYYYENDPALTASEIMQIKMTSLGDVITRNSTVDLSGDNIFSIID